MPDDGSWGPAIFGGSAGATILAAAIGAWDKWFRRKDERENKQEARLHDVLDRADAATASVIERLQQEMVRKEEAAARKDARIRELEEETDTLRADGDQRGDWAREWKIRCGSLLHELENARGAATGLAVSRGLPEPEWFDEALPPLDDIKEDNAKRRLLLASWKLAQRDKHQEKEGSHG